MAEVRRLEWKVSDNAARGCHPLVRQLQKIVQQPQLMKDLERRWMYRIAAEVAKEIVVLFDHRHFHAVTSEQIAEHHARGTAANNATRRVDGWIRHPPIITLPIPVS